jgi:hypothetical protein
LASRIVTVLPLTFTLIVVGFGGVTGAVAVVGGETTADEAFVLLLPQAATPSAAPAPPARAASIMSFSRIDTG